MAQILMPLRPSTLNSFPAMPGVCFMRSPTTATVASPSTSSVGFMAPSSISLLNSASSSVQARRASAGVMQIDVLVSDAVCTTMNTLMPPAESVVKMRRFTPMTPTIDIPLTVTILISLTDDMPRMGRAEASTLRRMTLPGAAGLSVFLT